MNIIANRRTLLSLSLTLGLMGCPAMHNQPASTPDTPDEPPAAALGSIVDVASEAGDFSTLLIAAEAAGLVDVLNDGGPFTVLAPTDAAFAALPEGTLDALLAEPDTLRDILLYHVVDGAFDAESVASLSLVTTLQGTDFRVSVDAGVFINDAEVTTADIEANNGIIHVIDTVLLPPGNIVDIAATDDRFTTLVAAVSAAGLVDALEGPGPMTVFAPTNAAFDALPEGTVEALLEDIPALTEILLYHVASGRLTATDVISSQSVTTLQGSTAMVETTADSVTIAGAEISFTDIPASNGVIYVIDAVMLP
jgi:uncharacterized surface protein with fasciclin (FAS1) repeats